MSAISTGDSPVLGRFGFHSFVYTASTVLQRGAAFLLLPLYTRYLVPSEYGILAVVTAINGFLVTLFSLSAHGAVTRFYFEYRHQPEQLRDFLGTVITFIVLTSLAGCTLLLTFGERWLAFAIGDVAFWPYVALGVMAVVFQPLLTTVLSLLQAEGRAVSYAIFSFANLACTLLLTIGLVVIAGWGATGPLAAALIVSGAFTIVALFVMRHRFRIGLKRKYLRQALAFGLPQIPHSLNWQIISASDRLLLNYFLGRQLTGVYSVAAMFGLLIDVVGQGINRAYVPLSMEAMSRRETGGFETVREAGLVTVAAIVLIAAAVALFARELLWLFAGPDYQGGAAAIPFVAMAAGMTGAYYVFITVLFHDHRGIRLLPLATFVSAVTNVAMNLLFIPVLGILGAALANLVSQMLTTVIVGLLGKRFDPVSWPYGKFATLYAVCLVAALAGFFALPRLDAASMASRFLILALLVAFLGYWLWGSTLHLPRALASLVRSGLALAKPR